MKPIFFPAFIALILLAQTSLAEDPEALTKTQDLMQNPSERNKAIQNSPAAQSADQQLQSLAGNSKNAEAIYKLAAEVMGNLVKQANGDPKKMMEILENAKASPDSFANTFSQSQKDELRDIAAKIPQSSTTSPMP